MGYAARLRFGGLRLQYHSTLLSPPGASVIQRRTLRASAPPRSDGRRLLRWRCAPLEVDGRWRALAAPVRRRVYDGPEGAVDWECLMPSASVRLVLDGFPVEGLGYAERVRMTVPPWSLPLETLRWGRFLAPGRAVVWVDWGGPSPRRWVFWNGAEQAGVVPGDEAVAGPSGDRLELGSPRVLRDAPLATVLSAVPRLAQRIPPWLGAAHETKWLSPGTIQRGDGKAGVVGWALHEVVRWRIPATV